MRIKLIPLAALFVISASVAAPKERTYEYKCWVTLKSGGDQIAMVRLDTKGNHSQARAQLAKDKSFKTNKGSKGVNAVHECVTLNGTFISTEARQLDQATVR